MGLLGTVSVCLVFLLPLLSSAHSQACQHLEPPCTCSGTSVTCIGAWPPADRLQQENSVSDLKSLTITHTNGTTKLDKCSVVFKTLTNLTRLDLSSNGLWFTKPRSFSQECFPNLEQLILDGNALRLNSHTTFGGLTKLRELSLKGGLYYNQSVSHQLTQTLTRSYLPSLEVIRLDDNNLGSLSPSTFNITSNSSSPGPRSRSKLTRILLRNTSLGVVSLGLFRFEMLPNLSFIDLGMNNITALVQENLASFDEFPALTLNLTGNPFTCNCNLEDFLLWLNETAVTIVDPDTVLCAKGSFSDSHIGQPVMDIDPDELKCRHLSDMDLDKQMKTSYILLIAVLSIIGLLALIILFMRRKEIVSTCNQMKQATKETFDTHHTSYVYSDISRATRDTPEHSAVDV